MESWLQSALVEGLVGCVGECAPAQLETEPDLTSVQCLTTILACLNHLLAVPGDDSGVHLSGEYLESLPVSSPVHSEIL